MSVVVLTGGPGAGKTTVMLGVSKHRVRCATIDVDDVRQMLRVAVLMDKSAPGQ